MAGLFGLNPKFTFLLFILLDLLCVGMGMGVPVFCILLGFPVGWYIVRRMMLPVPNHQDTLSGVLRYAIITSLFTFAIMLVIWGRMIILLFDPSFDFQNFGIPMILYEPKASFIGWLILMIFISPFLQLLTTIFGSYVTLLKHYKSRFV